MKTACPNCGQHFEIEAENIGCTAQCTSCGKDFVIQALQDNQTNANPPQPVTQNTGTTTTPLQTSPSFINQPATQMKTLTCEMCGSTNLMKQDGVFVCQSCGTKYSVEEAKKMMIEGTVTVNVSNERSFEKAKGLFDLKKYDEAKKEINKFIADYPTDIDGLILEVKITQFINITDAVAIFINLVHQLGSIQTIEKMADSLINDVVAKHDQLLSQYETVYNAGQCAQLDPLIFYSIEAIFSLDELYSELQNAKASSQLLKKIGDNLCRIYKINSKYRYIINLKGRDGFDQKWGWNAADLQKATSIYGKYNSQYQTPDLPHITGTEEITISGLFKSLTSLFFK